jgi:hypothetical protein
MQTHTDPIKYGLMAWRLGESRASDVCGAAFLQEAVAPLAAARAEFRNDGYGPVRADGTAFSIADGGAGSYAVGNITTPALRSGQAYDVDDADEDNYPVKVSYRDTAEQTLDGDFRCISLGAAEDALVPVNAIVNNWGGIIEYASTATDVAWSPALSKFCMVCNSAGAALESRVQLSSDGETWQTYGDLSGSGLPADANFQRVRWIAELGLFVAVGAPSLIMTSADGVHWTRGAVPAATDDAFSCFDVAYAAALGRLVVSKVSPDASVAMVYSDDRGTTWELPSNLPAGTNGYYTNIAWSQDLGLFVSLNQSGTTPAIGKLVSSDGIVWEALEAAPDTTAAQACVWSRQLQKFIATGGASGVGKAWYSSDGRVWETAELPPMPGTPNRCDRTVWIDELRCAVGAGERGMMHTFDGVTWLSPTVHPETAAASPRQFARCVAWSAELGKAVAIASKSSFFFDQDRIFFTTTPYPAGPNPVPQPLCVVGARCEGPVGWQIGGALGLPTAHASVRTSVLHDRRSVEGFIVYAAARQVASPGFPTVCNVIMLLGRYGWESRFGRIALRASSSPASNGFAYVADDTSRGLACAHLVLNSARRDGFVPDADLRATIARFLRRLRQQVFRV